ncbi:amidohydrolase [Roseovarius sp. 2305UL8-3]|uniref:amidohydrolase n=1 Tax=Roseovarius conchicola TaxID=3121636 RepID=UPI0035289D5A
MAHPADIVILNGTLITFDPAQPKAEALAVADGMITAVGSTADIRELAGPATRVVDAGGHTVLPGFIDSHVHLFGGSVEMGYLDLTDVVGINQLTPLVRDWAAKCPDETLVFAVQAGYDMMGEGRPTTRHDLDAVLPDRPFACFSPCHHTVWANTKALELGGVLHGGKVDAGAQIVMGEDGLAAGELQEPSAYASVLLHTRHGGRDMAGLTSGASPEPPATAAERAADKDAIERGMKHCASHGITGLHLMDGNFYQGELLSDLEEEGRILCRSQVPFHYKSFDPLDRFAEAAEMRTQFNSDWVWTTNVKMFMDGVCESRTALMLQPYPGTDHIGDAVFEADHFAEACVTADAMGLQIATHAIGDLGVRVTLDGYEAAQKANGVRDSRHRVEHIEVLHPDDLPRFAELDVVASIQPGHAPFGGIFPPVGMDEVLHKHQIPLCFAWQDIRNSGAKVVFSTDWPVIPVDVMPNIKGAVAPVPIEGWRDQTQSLMDTLESYTAGNAWVEFNEGRKGQLKPGMMADIAVMSHDLEAMEPASIDASRAVLTICGGRVTYEG